jgi:hypothetical protein
MDNKTYRAILDAANQIISDSIEVQDDLLLKFRHLQWITPQEDLQLFDESSKWGSEMFDGFLTY